MAILSRVCMWSRIVTFVLETNGLSFLLLSFGFFFYPFYFLVIFFNFMSKSGRQKRDVSSRVRLVLWGKGQCRSRDVVFMYLLAFCGGFAPTLLFLGFILLCWGRRGKGVYGELLTWREYLSSDSEGSEFVRIKEEGLLVFPLYFVVVLCRLQIVYIP